MKYRSPIDSAYAVVAHFPNLPLSVSVLGVYPAFEAVLMPRQMRVGIERRIVGMMAKLLAPHLVDHRGTKVCSVCTQTFATMSGPSLSVAFRKHVDEAHAEKKPRESVN
jgi:hypothetical protein